MGLSVLHHLAHGSITPIFLRLAGAKEVSRKACCTLSCAADKIMVQLWPWLPVITGYFYGIIHSINGVLLVLITNSHGHNCINHPRIYRKIMVPAIQNTEQMVGFTLW